MMQLGAEFDSPPGSSPRFREDGDRTLTTSPRQNGAIRTTEGGAQDVQGVSWITLSTETDDRGVKNAMSKSKVSPSRTEVRRPSFACHDTTLTVLGGATELPAPAAVHLPQPAIDVPRLRRDRAQAPEIQLPARDAAGPEREEDARKPGHAGLVGERDRQGEGAGSEGGAREGQHILIAFPRIQHLQHCMKSL